MAKKSKVLGRVVIFLAIILFAVAIFSYRLLKKSLPKTTGTLTLKILDQPVQVYRDNFGVPHLFAENETDLFKAAGYVMAQDRLWQMDFNRRVAAGRLSEILGKPALASDKFLRMWGFSRIAKELVKTISTESRAVYQAYTDGINAFIDHNRDKLPVEFAMLNYEPEKWKIEDSLAFTRMMAWRLSLSWYVDLVLHRLVIELGEKKAREIFPDFPADGPLILPKTVKSFWKKTQPFLDSGMALHDFLGIHGARLGSNSWVVSGEKSECGKPLLANDPHLTLGTPSVWYEMHLSGGDIDVAGVSFPGVPGVVIGHNRNMAWGMTNGMIDDVDFYMEKINPENSNQYWDGSQWLNFEIITEKIQVKDDSSVTLQIQVSKNGPIVSDFHSAVKGLNQAISMKWVGQQPSDEMSAVIKMMKSQNIHEFIDGLRHYRVPTQNFIFASSGGDIGYYLGGSVPIRRNASGILPLNGWEKTGQWIGEIDFEKLPHIINPPENYIATANNKIIDDRYPYYISNMWEPPSRVTRIHQLLQEKEKLSLDDFKAMQTDVTSIHAQTALPILISAIKIRADSSSNENLKILYDLIKDWDGVENEQSVAAAIFHAWFLKLIENTLMDEMGKELFRSYVRLANVPNRVMAALLQKSASDWFDDVQTEEVESMPDMIEKSLLDAGELLRELAGENVSDWAWGKIHTQTMEHPLGKRRPLDTLLNIGPLPRGGSTMTLNNAEYRYRKPFRVYLGPSTRQLVDLCDVGKSLSVIPTGQSGQRMSKHYKDQTELWLNGEYHPMYLDRNKIEETAAEHLTLTPKN